MQAIQRLYKHMYVYEYIYIFIYIYIVYCIPQCLSSENNGYCIVLYTGLMNVQTDIGHNI